MRIKNHQVKIRVLSFLCCCLLLFCGNPQSSKSSSIIYSERWGLTEPGTQNTAELRLFKRQDSSVTSDGQWIYNFYGSKVTCIYMAGTAHVTDSTIAVSAGGVGSYPPDSSGAKEQSGFLLNIVGKFAAKKAHGTWNIHFDDSTWNGWIDSGNFIGVLDSGGNVSVQ
jgi:hypothetical protein